LSNFLSGCNFLKLLNTNLVNVLKLLNRANILSINNSIEQTNNRSSYRSQNQLSFNL